MKAFVLTERQRKVLACSQFQAAASLADIASQTGLRQGTVRSALDTLKERNIIRAMTFIDASRIGLMDYCLYFNLRAGSESQRLNFLEYLRTADGVTWVAELAGQYQYTAALYVKALREVDRFFSRLSESCEVEITEKTFAGRISWSLFRSKYLDSGQCGKIEELQAGEGSGDIVLDKIDHNILALAAAPEANSPAKIARYLRLPNSTIQYRLRTLAAKGVIKGHCYRFDAISCGNFKFRVLLYQKKSAPLLAEKLYAFCMKHPNINCYVHCVGNWDYELSVETEQLHHISEIEQCLLDHFGKHITEIKVLTVLRHVKTCLYPFAPRA